MASKPENKLEKDVEDDFVILEDFDNMTDSAVSNASTIPEKQTFESQEKTSQSLEEPSTDEAPKHLDGRVGESSINEQSSAGHCSHLGEPSIGEAPKHFDGSAGESSSGSFSSLGDSMINEKPYYESSRFIEKQLNKEKMLGVLGEGSGTEKVDETCGEKGGSQSERGEQGEAMNREMSYGEGRVRGGVKRVEVSMDNVSGSVQGGKVKGDDEEVKGYGEGRARGGGKEGTIGSGGGDISGSWMCVEGKGGMDDSVNEEVGDFVGSVGGGEQKQGQILSIVDQGSVRKEGLKLECDEKQNEEKVNSVEDEGLDDGISDSENVEDLVPVERSSEEHLVAHTTDESNAAMVPNSEAVQDLPTSPETDESNAAMVPNSEAVQDLPTSAETAQPDMQHEQTDLDHTESDNMVSNQIEQDSPHLPDHDQSPSRQTSQNEPLHEDHTQSEDLTQSDDHIQSEDLTRSEDHTQFDDHTRSEDHTQSEDLTRSEDLTQSENYTQCEDQDLFQLSDQGGDHDLENKPENEPSPDELSPCRPPRRIEQVGYHRQGAENVYQDPPAMPRQAQENVDRQPVHEIHHQRRAERPREVNPPRNEPMPNLRATCCSWQLLFSVIVGVCAVYVIPYLIWPTNYALHPKPIIEMNTKTHTSPTASSWQLVAKCKAHNASYTVKHCRWTQIHPLPTTPGNTVLPGGSKECPPTTSTGDHRDVDATLHALKVPTDLGTYTFELGCGHAVGNLATKRVEIWVNELNPPIITVENPKVTVSTSTGSAKLIVLCRAVQGKVVERKWEYIDGPQELVSVTPSENGIVQLSQPGVYKFKYRCTDSFGGTALRYSVC